MMLYGVDFYIKEIVIPSRMQKIILYFIEKVFIKNVSSEFIVTSIS